MALAMLTAAAFAPAPTPAIEVYDGDTPAADRHAIRDRARLLITNPDMLHVSILPFHKMFRRLLASLRYVVVDEGHMYKGAFGCHVACVLRRLRRVCEREYGSAPTFVVTSATSANPAQHVRDLLGVQEVVVVDNDGSPHGRRLFVLWNPPLTHPPAGEGRRGNAEEALAPKVGAGRQSRSASSREQGSTRMAARTRGAALEQSGATVQQRRGEAAVGRKRRRAAAAGAPVDTCGTKVPPASVAPSRQAGGPLCGQEAPEMLMCCTMEGVHRCTAHSDDQPALAGATPVQGEAAKQEADAPASSASGWDVQSGSVRSLAAGQATCTEHVTVDGRPPLEAGLGDVERGRVVDALLEQVGPSPRGPSRRTITVGGGGHVTAVPPLDEAAISVALDSATTVAWNPGQKLRVLLYLYPCPPMSSRALVLVL
jgi:hypothetical protein